MNRKALHLISYGLYVVTSTDGKALNGQIVNTVMQVASKPPMVAVAINKENLTCDYIRESRVFAASVLGTDAPMEVIGEVVDADILGEGEPMTYAYYHQVKGGKTPEKATVYIGEED